MVISNLTNTGNIAKLYGGMFISICDGLIVKNSVISNNLADQVGGLGAEDSK